MKADRALMRRESSRNDNRGPSPMEEEILFDEATLADGDGPWAKWLGENGVLRSLAGDRGLDYLLRLMAATALCGTLLLPAYVWYDGRRLQEPPVAQVAKPSKPAAPKQKTPYGVRNALQIFGKRTYFQKPRPREVPQKETPVKSLPGLTDLYELQGILMGESPQAIIADKTAGRTLFVEKGQRLGDFEVLDIQADRIILQKAGERFELRI